MGSADISVGERRIESQSTRRGEWHSDIVDVWHHSFVLRVAVEQRDGVLNVVNRAGLAAQVVVFQGLWR